MLNKRTKLEIFFDAFCVCLMLALMFIMVYPLIYVVNASFSNSNALLRNGGKMLWMPLEFETSAYKMTFRNNLILSGYRNTIFIVVAGTLINLVMSALCAYPLSRKGPMLNSFLTKYIMITMYFSGGLVPSYILVKNLGMLDTYWSLLLPGAISTYNMIILRTGFQSIPDSLFESAYIDGAGHLTILAKIVLPLSKASMAVVGLYYAVTHWNSWFGASIYLQGDNSKWPLQLVLRQILIMNDVTSEAGMDEGANVAESIKYATIVVATVPILCIYPFIQKYFTKGVMVGAVKG